MGCQYTAYCILRKSEGVAAFLWTLFISFHYLALAIFGKTAFLDLAISS